jgi:FixJ family two-component response regulator
VKSRRTHRPGASETQQIPICGTVAIIDDDVSTCRALSRLLRAVGFEARTFYSGEDFLRNRSGLPFTCLLVDVQLGGISGLELQQILIADGNPTPVIFITAHDDPNVRTEAIRGRCAGFFRKSDPGALIIQALRDLAAASELRRVVA